MNSLKIERIPFEGPVCFDQTLENLMKLDGVLLDYPWKKVQWESFLNSQGSRRLLFKIAASDSTPHELEGFVLFQLNPWDKQAHLLKIALKPALRGSGNASRLFNEAKSWLEENGYSEVYLEVGSSNQRALGFYNKTGFLRLCVKKDFYSDGQDAIALLLRL